MSADTTLDNANMSDFEKWFAGEHGVPQNCRVFARSAYQFRQPEIDALKARAEGAEKRLKEMVDHNVVAFKNSREAYDKLKAENERLKKDAERYRWLRDNARIDWVHGDGVALVIPEPDTGRDWKADTDAAIDDAMSALPNTKGEWG